MCCAAAGSSALWVLSRPSFCGWSFGPTGSVSIRPTYMKSSSRRCRRSSPSGTVSTSSRRCQTKEIHRAKVLISRHRDGEFNAIAAERLGIGTIRGSGDHGSAFHRKGGVGAFKEMVRALEQGYNVALTADVPKRSRIAGLGIIMLARESGRPIMPMAMATSRFLRLKNWDRTTINLPFGRGALVGGEIIMVPPDAGSRGDGRIARASGGDAQRCNRARLCAGRPSGRGGVWLTPCR